MARACLAALGAQLQMLKPQILQFDRLIMGWHRSNETSKRLDWQATTFWPVFRPLFLELIRTPPARRDAEIISKGKNLSLAAARILNERLADRTFLAGDLFSMGDIPAAATVHRWYALDIEHPELPNLQRWYYRMTQRRPFRDAVMRPLS